MTEADSPCSSWQGATTGLVLALDSLEGEDVAAQGWLRLADRQTYALKRGTGKQYELVAAEIEEHMRVGQAEILDDHLTLDFAFSHGACRAGRFRIRLGDPLDEGVSRAQVQALAELYAVEEHQAGILGARPGQYADLAAAHERIRQFAADRLAPEHPQQLLLHAFGVHLQILEKNRPTLATLVDLAARQQALLGRADHDFLLVRLLHLLSLEEVGSNADAVALGEDLASVCPRALGPRHLLCARILATLAQSYLQLRNYPRTAALAQRAVAEFEQILGSNHPATLSARVGLAAAWYSQYRAGTAREVLEPILAAARGQLGRDHHLSLRVADLLGRCYYQLGHWREGVALAEEVRSSAMRSAPAGEPMRRYSTELLAWWYKELGRFGEAEALLREALSMGIAQLGEQHPMVAETRTQLALLLLHRGQPAAAFHQSDLAYRLARKSLGEDNHSTNWTRGIRAKALSELGRTQEALAEASAVARVFEMHHGERSAYATEAKTLAGRSLSLLGRHQEAAKILADASEDQRRIRAAAHIDHIEVLAELGEAHRRRGDLRGAATSWRTLVDEVEELREGIGPVEEYRQGVLAQWSPYYRKLAAAEAGLGDIAHAFKVVEQIKARSLLEALSARFADGAGLLGEPENERLRQLAAELARHDRILASTDAQSPERPEALRAKAQAARELRDYREALGKIHPKYAQLLRIEIKEASDLAKLVPAEAAFLSYTVLDDAVLIFAYTRETGLIARKVDVSGGLLPLVRAYRSLTEPPGPGVRAVVWRLPDGRYRVDFVKPEPGARQVHSAEPVARQLSRLLIAPAAAALERKRHWIVAPDESLALLPFEALPWKGKPAVARHELSYIQSLSVLALLQDARPQAQAKDMIFAMGDPDYRRPPRSSADDSATAVLRGIDLRQQRSLRGKQWAALPGTTLEVLRASRRFESDNRLLVFGAAASETTLQELNRSGRLSRFRYLLFATHAWLNTEVPQLSAVVLAQSDSTLEADGYVTAAEWLPYDLASDLIVLSGCETALGPTVRGEGVTGLPYALLIAGNRKTLLSLWKVDDEATAKLIPAVFEHLQAGHSAASALTLAKRGLLRHPKYRSPRYWAPFVLYGG